MQDCKAIYVIFIFTQVITYVLTWISRNGMQVSHTVVLASCMFIMAVVKLEIHHKVGESLTVKNATLYSPEHGYRSLSAICCLCRRLYGLSCICLFVGGSCNDLPYCVASSTVPVVARLLQNKAQAASVVLRVPKAITLEVACWPLVSKFAGSNLAEAVGFLRAKKSSARLPSEGK